MHIKNLLLIIILILITLNKPNHNQITINKINNKEIIGILKIEKINIELPIYKIDSKKNNIEENIELLKESILPPNENSIIFIAAHSGTSNISYFNNLNQLNINDEINISINNNEYTYQIIDIYKQKKNGYINVNKTNENQLILTTCDPDNNKYQLIINSIKKEFN